MAKSFGEALATGKPVVLTSRDDIPMVICRVDAEADALKLLHDMKLVNLVRPQPECICPPECHDEVCPVCIPEGPTPKSIEDAIEHLYSMALEAVEHVGAANYIERQREATQWVREAYDGLQRILAVYRNAKAGKEPVVTRYDWPADWTQENGMYQHTCLKCSNKFIGNKHRLLCLACHQLKEGAAP